jgi:hypothetical protein
MSRASSQARPGVHRFRGTATGGHGAHVPGLLPGAPLQALAAEARKVLPNRHLLERPSRTGFPACEPCHRSWNRTLVPSLPAVPSACPSQRLRAVTSGQRRLVEVGPYLAVQRRNRSGPPRAVPSSLRPGGSYKVGVGGGTDGGQRRSHRGCPGTGQIRRTGPGAAEDP